MSEGQAQAQATSKTFKKKGQIWYIFNVNARAVGDRKEEVLRLAAPSVEEVNQSCAAIRIRRYLDTSSASITFLVPVLLGEGMARTDGQHQLKKP